MGKLLLGFINRKKEPVLVDQDQLQRIIALSLKPKGNPKVPLYANKSAKKRAFRVIDGLK